MKVVIQRPMAQRNRQIDPQIHKPSDVQCEALWDNALFEVRLRPVDGIFQAFFIDDLKDLEVSLERDQSAYPILHKGFFDSHLHSIWMSLMKKDFDASIFESFEDLTEGLLNFSRQNRGASFLRGFNWDESRFGMSLQEITQKSAEIFSHIPVPTAVYRVCGHSALCNEKFLAAIGMPGHSSLVTDTHLEKVHRFFPPPSLEELQSAFLKSQAELLNLGITSIGEMSVDISMIEALIKICESGQLLIDVQACFDATKGDWLEKNGPQVFTNSKPIGPLDRPAEFQVKHWKKYLDGSFGSRSAWLTQNYLDHEAFGESLVSTAQLMEEASEALKKGFYLSFHCIGDAALDQALEVGDRLAELCKDRIRVDSNLQNVSSYHRLEHAQLIRDDQLERMKRQNLWTLCVQSGHRVADQNFIKNRLGSERSFKQAYRAGSFLDFNLRFALGSDAPIDKPHPYHVLKSAMNHPNPVEALSFSEAMWFYTTGARRNLGMTSGTVKKSSTVFLTHFEDLK